MIIAGAGGAAHLPGHGRRRMTTRAGDRRPGPEQGAVNGLDSLLSIVQMPGGVPVATMAIGSAGATNAGLFAVGMLATPRPALRARLQAFRDDARARRPVPRGRRLE